MGDCTSLWTAFQIWGLFSRGSQQRHAKHIPNGSGEIFGKSSVVVFLRIYVCVLLSAFVVNHLTFSLVVREVMQEV